jgi:hypothetical protein
MLTTSLPLFFQEQLFNQKNNSAIQFRDIRLSAYRVLHDDIRKSDNNLFFTKELSMRKDKPSRTAYKVALNIVTLGAKPGMNKILPPGIVEATEK